MLCRTDGGGVGSARDHGKRCPCNDEKAVGCASARRHYGHVGEWACDWKRKSHKPDKQASAR